LTKVDLDDDSMNSEPIFTKKIPLQLVTR